MYKDIVTSRLRLRLMPETFLELCLNNETAKAETIIGLKLSPEWFEEKDFMALRFEGCRSDPLYKPWSVRAIGLEAAGVMIGHIGFHSRPNPDYLQQFVPDGIEFGYTIFPPYRRQGYALEAIQGLLDWAVEEQDVRNFVVSIAPANAASMALAKKLGFVKVGEHTDEVDGLEEVYVLTGNALAQARLWDGSQ